jgi:hypothetical protein
MSNIKGLQEILNASTPEDLFGVKKSSSSSIRYRQLLKTAHPDMFIKPSDKVLAEKAFIKLNQLWEDFNGTKKKPNVVKTKKHEYVLNTKLYTYDGFVIYSGTYDNGHENCLFSFPIDQQDNDLNENHATVLKKIKKEIPAAFSAFYPNLIENFRFNINGSLKNFITYKQPEGFYSLADVKEDYPEGIPARDIAWMFRRLLVALGNANDIGVIHGGINLNSVLIHPEEHGLILRDWFYSVEEGEALTALPESSKTFYPQYVFDKEPARRELDIMLAAKTMELLLQENAPRPLKAFLKGCQLKTLPTAADLLGEFDELLKNMWGARRFHVFQMKRTSV